MKTRYRLVAVALLAGLGMFGRGMVQAQTLPGSLPPKIYTKRTAFKLPFKVDETERADLQEVKLYVKEGPNEQWTVKETVQPSQADFTYKVTQDGEYWFSVVTVDKAGHMTPPDVTREAPGLIVVVDTQAPDFDLTPRSPASGETCLQCKIKDANPDYTRTKVEYQGDKTLEVLDSLPDKPDLFRLPGGAMKGVVRVTVADRAGNSTTREVNLKDLHLQTAEAGHDNGHETCHDNGHEGSHDNGPLLSQADKHVETVAHITPGMPALPAAGPAVQLINSTHATLDYKLEDVGASGIGKMAIWMTRDEGQTWQMLSEDMEHHSPAEIDLPGEGQFGLTLVVTNGHGIGGTPPAKGDVPDWWVEVDTTKPTAQLESVHPGTGEDLNAFVISWTAGDKNLKAEPIDLYYATKHDGPWLPIARNLKNTGSYHWPVPANNVGPEFYFRMEVTDRAGNTTRCEPSQPVVLDMSRPKVHIVDLKPGDPRLKMGKAQ